MKIYLATWLEEPSQAKALNNTGALNRLLSYYFLGKRPKVNTEIEEYMKDENLSCRRSRKRTPRPYR